MNLGELMRARQLALPRPSWNAIFTKAHAKVAVEIPELRQVFVRWPWGRLYEHPENLVTVAVEAELDGEKIVVPVHVNSPEQMDFLALDQMVRDVKQAPLTSKGLRRYLKIYRLPRPLRRLLYWIGLEWSGASRVRKLGTCAVTSVSFAGADAGTLVSPLAHSLSYGPVDAAGNVRVQLAFDHRIMDGAVAARAVQRLEAILNSDILAELRGLQAKAAA